MRINDFFNREYSSDWQSLLDICEDFTQKEKPGSRPGSLKKKAAAYLGAGAADNGLSKTELRQLLAKAKKMKTSTKKEERARGVQLEKQVRWAFNFRHDKK